MNNKHKILCPIMWGLTLVYAASFELYAQNTGSGLLLDGIGDDELWLTDEQDDPPDGLTKKEKISVGSLIITIGQKTYKDISFTDGESKDMPLRLGLLMRTISLRKGDILTGGQLRHKIAMSLYRLRALPYVYSERSAANAEFLVQEEKDAEGRRMVNVYFSVNKSIGMGFGGGNAFAYLGLYLPRGSKMKFYGGVNRQEFQFLYSSIPLKTKTDGYHRGFFDAGFDLYNYWVWPTINPNPYVPADFFMYGTKAYAAFSPHPTFSYSVGVGFTARSTLGRDLSKVLRTTGSGEIIEKAGIPLPENTGIAVDVRNTLNYRLALGHTDVYQSYAGIRVPLIIGYANNKIGDALQAYGVLAGKVSVQFAFKTGEAHHAFMGSVGFTTGYQPGGGARPFHSKINLMHGFYNTIDREVDISRRGSYPVESSIGDVGYAATLEYKIGGRLENMVGFSGFLFYDIAAAADDYGDLATNTRHTVGPGFILHMFDPVGLDFSFSLGFGGTWLGNPDGRNISFDISVFSNS